MQRPCPLAGTWYPADPTACRHAIVLDAADFVAERGAWRGAIVPHAGWRYSGAAAAQTLACLAHHGRSAAAAIDTVVIFGSHRGPKQPSSIFLEAAWDTPLGPWATDLELAVPLARALDLAAEPCQPRHFDNGIEVLLPQARHFFPQARLLAVAAAASQVALTIGDAVGSACRDAQRAVVFLGSTDLTHYGPAYDFAPMAHGPAAVRWVREVNDRGLLGHVQAGDAAAILQHASAHRSACCPGAAAAALRAAQQFGKLQRVHEVSHYLSYDVHADANFVGYAGLVFE